MAEPSWDDVGQRFTELGRQLREHWNGGESSEGGEAATAVKDAVDNLTAALNKVGEAVNASVSDPEVRDKAKGAATTFLEALAASIDVLAEKVSGALKGNKPESPD